MRASFKQVKKGKEVKAVDLVGDVKFGCGFECCLCRAEFEFEFLYLEYWNWKDFGNFWM